MDATPAKEDGSDAIELADDGKLNVKGELPFASVPVVSSGAVMFGAGSDDPGTKSRKWIYRRTSTFLQGSSDGREIRLNHNLHLDLGSDMN